MIRIAVIRDASVLQTDDASGILLGELRVVGHHDDQPVFGDLLQQLHNLDRGLGVQRARRFVRQQDIRVVHQGAGDGDALHLAAGHLVRLLLKLIPEPDFAQGFLRPAAALGMRHARDRQRQLHIRQNRLVGDQVIGLKDKSDGVVAVGVPVGVRELSGGASVDNQISRAEAVQTPDDVQQCRLTAARVAQDRDKLTLSEFKIDSLERMHLGVGDHIVFFDVPQLQHAPSSSALACRPSPVRSRSVLTVLYRLPAELFNGIL